MGSREKDTPDVVDLMAENGRSGLPAEDSSFDGVEFVARTMKDNRKMRAKAAKNSGATKLFPEDVFKKFTTKIDRSTIVTDQNILFILKRLFPGEGWEMRQVRLQILKVLAADALTLRKVFTEEKTATEKLSDFEELREPYQKEILELLTKLKKLEEEKEQEIQKLVGEIAELKKQHAKKIENLETTSAQKISEAHQAAQKEPKPQELSELEVKVKSLLNKIEDLEQRLETEKNAREELEKLNLALEEKLKERNRDLLDGLGKIVSLASASDDTDTTADFDLSGIESPEQFWEILCEAIGQENENVTLFLQELFDELGESAKASEKLQEKLIRMVEQGVSDVIVVPGGPDIPKRPDLSKIESPRAFKRTFNKLLNTQDEEAFLFLQTLLQEFSELAAVFNEARQRVARLEIMVATLPQQEALFETSLELNTKKKENRKLRASLRRAGNMALQAAQL